jgi:CRISPR/Cas system-associated exonuclease Cas4 (RecB family)
MHFTPAADPSDAMFDAIAADQTAYIRPSLTPRTTYQEMVCYRAGSEVPVRTVTIGLAGTFNPGTPIYTPLETAAYFRFTTTQRTSKNHPIYLGQYLHDILIQPSQADRELANSDQTENMRQWLARWVAGFSVTGVTIKKAGPYGAVAQSLHVPLYVTHRDFPS